MRDTTKEGKESKTRKTDTTSADTNDEQKLGKPLFSRLMFGVTTTPGTVPTPTVSRQGTTVRRLGNHDYLPGRPLSVDGTVPRPPVSLLHLPPSLPRDKILQEPLGTPRGTRGRLTTLHSSWTSGRFPPQVWVVVEAARPTVCGLELEPGPTPAQRRPIPPGDSPRFFPKGGGFRNSPSSPGFLCRDL